MSAVSTGNRLKYQGSRWEVTPSYLEVATGPWGTDFGIDFVRSWKAAVDWHADNGLNVIIANIPYSRTDCNYLGWPFHYILDLADYPHHEDLFSSDFRERNVAALSEIFAYGASKGVLMLVHHFNYMAPRRMAVAMGWTPRYPCDEADWTDGPGNKINPLLLLTHNCCWNIPTYREFMKRCWTETVRVLPDVGGFLVTPGEGNHGHYADMLGDPMSPGTGKAWTDYLQHWYPSDMRYVETSAHFIRAFADTVRAAGKFPLVRSWSVEGAPHFMPRGVNYLLKHQLFDCIDAPGDPLVRKWLGCGHEMWVEAAFIGENAGPIQWASGKHFRMIAEDILSSGVIGMVTNHKGRDLMSPVNWLGFEQIHKGLKSPAALDDRAPWSRRLAPVFGNDAEKALQAMELISHGVLLPSKIAHRVGEGWGFSTWPTFTPPLQDMLNLGHENGTPPPCWRGNLFTIKEYLDWLGANPWEEGWMAKARGARECPLEALESAIADGRRAESILESIRPVPGAPAFPHWQELRCSAGSNRRQCEQLLHMCRAKLLFASCRACPDYESQKRLAEECLEAFAACEKALAMEREWLIQYPPDHRYIQSLCGSLGANYRKAVRQFQPYKRELRRFLDGKAWTLSRHELMWRAIGIDEVVSQPHISGDGIPLAPRRAPWPGEEDAQ